MPLNASELLITLTGPAHLPLRVRLAGALRDAIRSGQLAGGTTLPSTRILAQDLGLSRGVVVDAYAQLAAEGFVRTRPGGPRQWCICRQRRCVVVVSGATQGLTLLSRMLLRMASRP